jgi:apolipoprotein N-acyltransferase
MGWIAAILSGTLAGFSYPTVFSGHAMPDLGWFAFFSWVPLFYFLHGASVRRAFLLSFFASLLHYSISMYWLYTAMNSFGGLSPMISVAVLLLLIFFLSAYFGIIFLISQWIIQKTGWSSIWVRPWVWVAIEFLRGHIPTGGLPWSQIGYSQGGFLTFIQSADLFGVYGVTFLLVLVNESIALVFLKLRGIKIEGFFRKVMVTITLVLINLSYGFYRLHQELPATHEVLKVGIAQGNTPQEEKWDPLFAREIVENYQEATKTIESQGADLILWPEASFPFEVPFDQKNFGYELGNSNAQVLLGVVTRSQHSRLFRRSIYNSALLVSEEGEILDYYHKRHLVPFGEYVPWKEILFFAKTLTAQVGDLVPGNDYRPIHYGQDLLGVLICYEDIFPEIARQMVAKGANALVNLTNDAWYGTSSAAYQHQVFSQLRSIETRRALIRATNTGISSLIDRNGKIVWQGGLFQRENFLSDLPLYSDRSVYVRMGDLLPVFSIVLTLGMMGWGKRKRFSPYPGVR